VQRTGEEKTPPHQEGGSGLFAEMLLLLSGLGTGKYLICGSYTVHIHIFTATFAKPQEAFANLPLRFVNPLFAKPL
jgi:hypothetical protein